MFHLFRKKEPLMWEAFHAYLNRLPERVEVAWEKEGDLIIGRVHFDDFQFTTQAHNVQEFIDMVNEGILVSYNTPKEYLSILMEHRGFLPPESELDKLIKKAEGKLRIHKNAEEARRAVA